MKQKIKPQETRKMPQQRRMRMLRRIRLVSGCGCGDSFKNVNVSFPEGTDISSFYSEGNFYMDYDDITSLGGRIMS